MDYLETKDIIARGGVLSKKDLSFVVSSILDIQKNWEKRQMFRTETEMRISVLNDIKFPTNASKYWQAVREQAVFYENLVTLSFSYRRNSVEQKKLLLELENASDLDKDLLQIDLEEKQFAMLNMEQVAKERMREIRLWSKIMQELDDGSFDTKDVNNHQLLSYGLRFEAQLKNVGNNASPSEMANLIGQYDTAVRHLEAEGIERPNKGKVHAIRINK